MIHIAIKTECIKLDSFLKLTGAVLSGGEAKNRIQAGEVKVNTEVCTMRGKKLISGDVIKINRSSDIYKVVKEGEDR